MSLRDSELIAVAAAASRRSGGGRPSAARSALAQQGAFLQHVLRPRDGRTLLLLTGEPDLNGNPLPRLAGRTVVASLLPLPAALLAAAAPLGCTRASLAMLPLATGAFQSLAELAPSAPLAVERESDAVELLRELARVLARGGRYVCGGGFTPPPLGAILSPDKRRLDDWRPAGAGVFHHTLQLTRGDGSWRRLHERLRVRSLAEVESLLTRAGFAILNAFEGYDQRRHAVAASGNTILLCERR